MIPVYLTYFHHYDISIIYKTIDTNSIVKYQQSSPNSYN